MNIHDAADKLGVRCIGLGQMMHETGMDQSVKIDCEKYESRFPKGTPAIYNGEPVLVRRMHFDQEVFPFYRVVFELNGKIFMVGGDEIGNTFHWR